uniref:Uncharacterized protein n=1 Tax=Ignisphaera aggregans TaxID=334771 RepID=A0A7C5UXA7_9CREN
MPINKEYIAKRAASLVFVVLGVIIITFIITRIIPARPELLWTGPHCHNRADRACKKGATSR